MPSMRTEWAPAAVADYIALEGKPVYSADGENVGTITKTLIPSGDFAAANGRNFFLLDPGLLEEWFGGGSDVYLPASAIVRADDEGVRLSLTKDEIRSQGWTARPAVYDGNTE